MLVELDQIEGIEWIRLMYLYPMYIDDELLDTIAGSQRILPYVDIPLQHASDSMLRRMSRRVNRSDTQALLTRMRQRIPGLVIRTTFITGFPGETEQDIDELYEFIDSHQFERLGIFTYSLEPDTPAARLPGHVDPAVAARRRDRLMQLQQEIAFRWNESRIGQQVDVLIDHPLDEQPGVWLGRSEADAPDIDGLVFVTEQEGLPLESGAIVRCEVAATQGYDLVAVPVELAR